MLSDFTNGLHLGLLFITLFTGMLLYFRLAEFYKIIDKPDERSSYGVPTIRGGGIVFVLALLCWFSLYRLSFPWFVIGAMLLAMVSFVDDLRSHHPVGRAIIQFIALALIIRQTGIYLQPWWIVSLIFIIGIGAINAFNFMDGINGITGIYALVNLLTFYYINTEYYVHDQVLHFGHTSLIVFMIVAVVVFLFFNFREHARCLAGDVGSVTLAFVQIFLLLQLIGMTGNFKWALIFLVYGVDSVVTIVYRLRRGENIFKAHRSHLYQYLSNELGVSQLWVSIGYGLLQLIVNFLLVDFLNKEPFWESVIVVLVVGFSYVAVREIVLKRVGVRGLI
jgi:UDP-GlcNAc:undecaprenyl-phosphate/decaprenyl-phosphate GlcNAc-1-phosphate transferase